MSSLFAIAAQHYSIPSPHFSFSQNITGEAGERPFAGAAEEGSAGRLSLENEERQGAEDEGTAEEDAAPCCVEVSLFAFATVERLGYLCNSHSFPDRTASSRRLCTIWHMSTWR